MKIFIADDIPTVLLAIRPPFVELGHTIITAGCGVKALDVLQSEASIDVAVLDY